jgi:hypothetical protein
MRTETAPPTNTYFDLAVIRLPKTPGRDRHILCTKSEILKVPCKL